MPKILTLLLPVFLCVSANAVFQVDKLHSIINEATENLHRIADGTAKNRSPYSFNSSGETDIATLLTIISNHNSGAQILNNAALEKIAAALTASLDNNDNLVSALAAFGLAKIGCNRPLTGN